MAGGALIEMDGTQLVKFKPNYVSFYLRAASMSFSFPLQYAINTSVEKNTLNE